MPRFGWTPIKPGPRWKRLPRASRHLPNTMLPLWKSPLRRMTWKACGSWPRFPRCPWRPGKTSMARLASPVGRSGAPFVSSNRTSAKAGGLPRPAAYAPTSPSVMDYRTRRIFLAGLLDSTPVCIFSMRRPEGWRWSLIPIPIRCAMPS